eukprot:TRINITY_DN34242_c0_g2_i1.p2 TRINITY_DN34242_c0_g2~~TRINITY_DN34242_c0_g2_i1.p2  ORF type:complete len:105 (-),score=10.07 TRINITY_DN34242_c0_g2_i1:158-472(-)
MSSTSSSAAGQKASRAGGYSAAATSTGGAGESSSPLAELLPKLPAGQVQDAFAALRIAHVAEVSASVSPPLFCAWLYAWTKRHTVVFCLLSMLCLRGPIMLSES